MFIGYYNKSIYLTFLGILLSVIGISISINYGYSNICGILMILAGICDCFDGYVASLVKRNEQEKNYGIQLDSLADVVCSGVFPIVIGCSLGYTGIFDCIVYFVYIFAGITRLAYFNVLGDNKYFMGCPITVVTFLFPLLLFFTTNRIVVLLFLCILSFMYLLKIKIKKLSLKQKIIVSVCGLLFVIIMGLFL